jgi:hypothetical protein
VSGKATRDALFLTSLDFNRTSDDAHCNIGRLDSPRHVEWTNCPPHPAGHAGACVLRGQRHPVPHESLLRSTAPSSVAIAVYLHISAAGPLLASGWWLITSERFDPRTAKKGFREDCRRWHARRVAWRPHRRASWPASTAIPAMLPLLAGFQFCQRVLVRRLAHESVNSEGLPCPRSSRNGARSTPDWRMIAEQPYLRRLAALGVCWARRVPR